MAPPALGYAMPGAVQIQPYRSARPRANWVVGLLAFWIVLGLISLLSSFMQLQLLNRVEAGEEISTEEANANDTREAVIGIAQIGLYVATVVVYLMWLHRARKNLEPLGALGAQYSPGWSIGAWFVPILNLFRPYQIVQEVYKGSAPRDGGSSSNASWQFQPGSHLVGWWWAAWIVSSLIDRVSFRVGLRADELSEYIQSTQLDIASLLFGMGAALLCMGVVRTITARQEQTAEVPAMPYVSSPVAPPI
jgi:hypothetical protein